MVRLLSWLVLGTLPALAQTSGERYVRAGHFLEEGKADSAIIDFQKAAADKKFEHRIDALLSLGRIYFENYHNFDQAIRYYQTVYNEYSKNPLRAHAVFMLGFIHANGGGKTEKAKAYYQQFLREYPGHELGPSVRFELEHLGKNPDDVLIPHDNR